MRFIDTLKMRWRYWRHRDLLGSGPGVDPNVYHFKTREALALEADLWQDVDPDFADMLRGYATDDKWADDA